MCRSGRPNGPGDPSPGMRPQADSLGQQAPQPCGLTGREILLFGSPTHKPLSWKADGLTLC